MSSSYIDINTFAYLADFAPTSAPTSAPTLPPDSEPEVQITLLDPVSCEPVPRWVIYGKNCINPNAHAHIPYVGPAGYLLSLFANHCTHFYMNARLTPYLSQEDLSDVDEYIFLSLSRDGLMLWVTDRRDKEPNSFDDFAFCPDDDAETLYLEDDWESYDSMDWDYYD